jgi:hypothetical protein
MSTTCVYCGAAFEWSLVDGKYSPSVNGARHDCRQEAREKERKAARRDTWKRAHSGELRERASVLHDADELDRAVKEAVR